MSFRKIMIQLSRLYSRRLSCIYHQISEGRAFDPEKQKNLPRGKSNKKEYSAHHLMVEISGIEPLTYAAVNAA